MNTNNIKKYAPQARREFMAAVAKRLNQLGIDANKKGELQLADATVTGSVMQISGNSFAASLAPLRSKLVTQAEQQGFAVLVEHMAYTWFNRLCAIRYMELKDYLGHGLRVLSHTNNPKGFEILDHAEEAATELELDRNQVIELKLAGNQDEALYRILLLGQCHKLHQAMPFLFESLDDCSELLLPDNLTRTDSVLRGLVDSIPEEDWDQVEVIGWLYQFYVLDEKERVDQKIKAGKTVESSEVPAKTQLFTPNWIVKYLVQNSVGRHWLQTYPDSAIKADLEYYIEPGEQPEDVLAVMQISVPDSIAPESIKVLDPACGSGHILIEAYNVLKAIYEDRGYRSREIPLLILENNLFGIDIDDRAAQLSGFALMMMARQDDRRIFERSASSGGPLKLNVLSLQQSDHLDVAQLWHNLNLTSSWDQGTSMGLFEESQTSLGQEDSRYSLIERTLTRFEQAKTFGSLIDVPAAETDELAALLSELQNLAENGDIMQKPAAKTLLPFIHQAWLLAQRYDAVVANPPYMGSKGMNAELKEFAGNSYPNSKSDLFAIFMEHAFSLLKPYGFNAQINMQSWMFLSSYEKLRKWILESKTILTMAHLGARAFSQISGEVVQTTAWIIINSHINNFQPVFYRLIDGNENDKKNELLADNNKFYKNKQNDFNKIPGSPISYWISNNAFETFQKQPSLSKNHTAKSGIMTGNDPLYLRLWHEVRLSDISFGLTDSSQMNNHWYPISKGGIFRKWSGNNEHIINLKNDSHDIRLGGSNFRLREKRFYFKPYVTWSRISGTLISFRYLEGGVLFADAAPGIFAENNCKKILAILNSKVSSYFLAAINPTLNYQTNDIERLPIITCEQSNLTDQLIHLAKSDWDSYEASWDFIINPLVSLYLTNPKNTLIKTYKEWINYNTKTTLKMQRLEEQNNSYFISKYFLNSELKPNVPLEEITLTGNPYYRYGSALNEKECEDRSQSDTIAELISYAIGCMMGRYSLDREGLVYAHAGNEGFADLVAEGAYSTFAADEDGIIPFTDQEWFKDDATNLFRDFIRTAWDENHLQENLDFVAESLCLYAIKPRKNESSLEVIRRYLSTQFYKDHLKTYKKRPIYWLFSSGKQKAFECLVYLHRYNEGTLARMRTEYVSPLLGKYDAYAEQLDKQIDSASSTVEGNRLKKELTTLHKKQVELREFDDKLKHFADMRISIDLDDGVKVNYGKFGDLLANVKDITGSTPEVK